MKPAYSVDTVIVGAGPAGLAVAAGLQQAKIPFTLLEQATELGASWRQHYDRLCLHTDKTRSQLPDFPFPDDCPRYPSKTQFIRYLEAYADHFHIRPRFGQPVRRIRSVERGWEVVTEKGCYRAKTLVLSTGYARVPVLPAWPGQDTYQGPIIHSSQYKNGAEFQDQKVLVVGLGNSGAEIALDLVEHGAFPAIAVRGPVNALPRELFGRPILAHADFATKLPMKLAESLMAPLLRWKVGDLKKLGLKKLPYGPLTQIQTRAQIPLIDTGVLKSIREGRIETRSEPEGFDGLEVHFKDQRPERFEAVVLATGYRPKVGDFFEDAGEFLDLAGTPHTHGAEVAPGLYFCGYRVSPRGALGDIAMDAKAICRAIQRSASASSIESSEPAPGQLSVRTS